MSDNRYLIEENMIGWIIESNHLVDALLTQAGDTGEVVAIMQRRYGAAYQTVLALRQHIDGLRDEIAELRIHIAQQQRWLDELDKTAQEPA